MKTSKEWKALMDDEDSQVDMRQFLSDYEALESYCTGLEGVNDILRDKLSAVDYAAVVEHEAALGEAMVEHTARTTKIERDTGGGCSICGDRPAVNVEGTYWLCGTCVNEKLEMYKKENRHDG